MADTAAHERPVIDLDRAVIRFAGDSGDGMQLTGDRFTTSSALFGNDLSTLPDFPAEIRAPAGTLAGVSAFQVHISDHDILTPGRPPERAGGHEPGRPEGQHGRRTDRRDASSSTATPSTSGPCTKAGYADQPADRRQPQRLHGLRGADDLADPGGGQAVRHQAARRRAVQELLRPRPHQLAVHPAHRAHAAVDPAALRQDADGGRGQHPGLQGRAGTSARRPSCSPPPTRSSRRSLEPGQLHQHLRATPPWPGA